MAFTSTEKEFLRLMSVSIIVPQRSTTTSELLQEVENEEDLSLLDAPQRRTLFFDERLNVHLVLKLPECPEEQLNSILSRLELNIEIWAISVGEDSPRSANNTVSSRELVLIHSVPHEHDPIVLVTQDDDDRVFLNLLWETSMLLQRPRARMHDVHFTFHPTAVVRPLEAPSTDEEYLEPFEIQDANVFQPLQGAKGFEKNVPFLSSARLQPILPVAPKQASTFSLHSTPSNRIKIYPVAITKLRYSNIGTSPATPSAIAILDLEVAPFIDISATIDSVDLSLSAGESTSLTQAFLPIACQSRDCVTFIHQLEAKSRIHNMGLLATHHVAELIISIFMTIELSPECKSAIHMQWSNSIDFAQVSRPRPSSQLPQQPANSGPEARSSFLRPDKNVRINPSESIVVSVSSQDGPVHVGKPFRWQIFVQNNTTKVARLAIIPLPRMQKVTSQAQHYARRHATKTSRTSIQYAEKKHARGDDELDVAQAYIDDNILYAMQRSGANPAGTDLVSLTPELRISPLGPGQCHEGQIEMVAFKTGALMVDVLRIVDLVKEAEDGINAPGVVTDIRDLPDVIVE